MSALLGKPIASQAQYTSLFVLPTVRQIPAQQCAFALAGGDRVTAVNVRVTSQDVSTMFRVLDSYRTPALARVSAVTEPVTAAYWQSIGSTLWARQGDQRVVAVELVSDAPDPRDQSVALQLALDVLSNS